MKSQREHVIDFVFSLSLLCVFAVCGLLVVFIGVKVYENTAYNMEEAFSDRTAMSYVAKQVRQNDRVDGVSLGEVEGTTALILSEEINGEIYCTYIYYYDGYLREIYAKESFAPVLLGGQSLIEIDGFDAAVNEDGTLTISIEESAGTASLTIALQSSN